MSFRGRQDITIISLGSVGLLFSALMFSSISSNGPNLSLESYSIADFVEPLLPAVVSISTTTQYQYRGENQVLFDSPVPKRNLLEEFLRELFEQMQTERSFSNIGSGFIIDNKGHIVTTNYMVEDADQIRVILNNNTEFEATLVGRDPRTDIAVLKIESDKKLPFVLWSESEKLRVGDQVIAIGSPFGLAGTVTTGIISYINHGMNGRLGSFIGEYIQTDAAINPGSAGGPLCDMKGKVVGMNVGFFSPLEENIGIGFAIPSEIAKKIVKQILLYGHVKRGWLGISIQAINSDIGESLGLKDRKGALINGIVKNSPAAKADLRTGDVILKLGNEEIKDERSLLKIVENLPIGSQVTATIFRRGKILLLLIQVGAYADPRAVSLPESEARVEEIYGMILQALTGDTRRLFDISCDIQGVLIFDVQPKSPAAKKGIEAGDIITEINQEEVTTLQQALDLFKKAEKANKKRILLLINRNTEPRYISLPIS